MLRFAEATREIPAARGTSFGVEIVASSDPWRPFTRLAVVMTNPPITNPSSGETFSTHGFEIDAPTGQVRPIVYTFHEPWEIAPGTWRIDILHEDDLLASEEFLVAPP